jgi:hypothetical protein
MRYLLAAVLYTALAATANADMSDLEALRAGDMRKLQIHSAARPAPDTVFLHADGSELRLSDYRGKVVVLNFWDHGTVVVGMIHFSYFLHILVFT